MFACVCVIWRIWRQHFIVLSMSSHPFNECISPLAHIDAKNIFWFRVFSHDKPPDDGQTNNIVDKNLDLSHLRHHCRRAHSYSLQVHCTAANIIYNNFSDDWAINAFDAGSTRWRVCVWMCHKAASVSPTVLNPYRMMLTMNSSYLPISIQCKLDSMFEQ